MIKETNRPHRNVAGRILGHIFKLPGVCWEGKEKSMYLMSANDAMGISVWNSQLGVYTGRCDSGTVQLI